jgi:hypothetical protein
VVTAWVYATDPDPDPSQCPDRPTCNFVLPLLYMGTSSLQPFNANKNKNKKIPDAMTIQVLFLWLQLEQAVVSVSLVTTEASSVNCIDSAT